MPSNSTVDIVMSVANGSMDAVCISFHGSCAVSNSVDTLSKLMCSPDGSPNASPWPQVLGTRLRDWDFPVSIPHWCSIFCNQPWKPALLGHYRSATVRMVSSSVSRLTLKGILFLGKVSRRSVTDVDVVISQITPEHGFFIAIFSGTLW